MNRYFAQAARWMAVQCGHAYAFAAAALLVLVWLATGPVFNWSDTWQLVANTATSLVTFLMVFLLQHSQNRDTLAIQLKLDELIASSAKASNQMQRIEDQTEEELIQIRERRQRAISSVKRKR
jgi:low affinity Fe/Cu permease